MSFTTNRSSLRRRFLFGSSVLTLVGLLAIGVEGCDPLPDIDAKQCGNHVIEPDNGEVCDENTTACGAPATIGACRFICDYQVAGACAPGYGCGIDQICRKSDGLSDAPISIAGGGIQKLLSGDFDGDGRTDIAAVDFSSLDVHFLTTEGYIESTVTLPNEVGFPSIGDVNGDGRSDIVLPLDRSVGVLLGQEDRTFAPQSYVTMLVAPNTRQLVPLGAYTKDSVILSFSENMGKTSVEFLMLNEKGGHERIPAGAIAGSLAGAVATKGVVVANTICGAAAFELNATMSTPAQIVVGRSCANNELTFEVNSFPPGYSPWAGVYTASADKNGFEYLFFGMTDGNPSLQVVKSNNVNPEGPAEKFLDFEPGNCFEAFPSLASVPLAIGDVNKDGYPDVVDSRGILLYTPDAAKRFTRLCHEYAFTDPMNMMDVPAAWTNAVIADFNGDGRDDVLAARKGQGVLDLWSWQAGGFNTTTIAISGTVAELVSGDLDGDTIADAAFRLIMPPTPPMGESEPAPLFAMFGNPLGLPSPPQVVGFVKDMQQLAIGRINGKNAGGQADILSDLVVLSAIPPAPNDPPEGKMMPLTLVQGNFTRNLLSPLRLQSSTTLDQEKSDQVNAVFVSKVATVACPAEDTSSDPKLAPSNIMTVGERTIWIAGFNDDGSSVPIEEDVNIGDARFLFAPVDPDRHSKPASDCPTEPAPNMLATFMNTPTFSNQMPPPSGRFGLGLIGVDEMGVKFKPLADGLPEIDIDMRLPSITNPDAPYAFADIDNNGRRDVILTAQKDQKRIIYVFWNGDDKAGSGPFNISAQTSFPFSVPNTMPGNMGMMGDIVDIAALNLDDDPYKELAILVRDRVYFAKLSFQTEQDPSLPAKDPRQLTLMTLMDIPASVGGIRGGQALLAIDANSDGIDDLVVADSGKLLLFVGTERLQ